MNGNNNKNGRQFKILQFGRYFPPHIGGTENVILDLTEELNELGYRCDVLCCNESFSYSEEQHETYKVFRTSTMLKVGSIAISPQQIFKLKKIWRNYDVIHVHHPAPMATVALRLINPRCKIVVYWHSDIIRQKILLWFFKPLQNWLLKRANAIIATTPYYIKESDALQKYPHKTSFIPLGIVGLQPSSNETVERLRSKFLNKKVIFSLGRLVEYKGYKYLVEAAKYLPDDYLILIGGDGRLKSEIAAQIENNGLQNKVLLLGRLTKEEVIQYFELCRLFCLPSVTKNEAFGVVLAEAMSLGKPIVATRIPGSGVHWVNQHAVSGLNVSIESPKELADAMSQILENPETERTYKSAAWQRFDKLFRKEMMAASFAQLYTKI